MVDWIALQREFDKITDVDEMFYFIIQKIDELKICDNIECKIFPESHTLDLIRMQFDTYKTLENAEEKLSPIEFKKFKESYHQYIVQCKRVFNKIKALKVVKETKYEDQEKNRTWLLTIIQEMNKSNMPFPVDFQKAVQGQINDLTLALDDPNLIKERERFKFQNQNSEKDIEKKPKKEGSTRVLNLG